MWQHWINFLVGLWVILSGFINLTTQGMQTNLIISGIVIAVLAIWGALSSSQSMGQMTR
jgi:hypothetical protein